MRAVRCLQVIGAGRYEGATAAADPCVQTHCMAFQQILRIAAYPNVTSVRGFRFL